MRTKSCLSMLVYSMTVLLILSIPANASPTKMVAISAGPDHCIALGDDGSVWEWGSNWQGGLTGVPDNKLRHEFPQLIPLDNVTSISAGMFNNVVLKENGTVWSWGSSPSRIAGGDTKTFNIVQVPIMNVTAVYAGAAWAFAVKDDGSVWAWGGNPNGYFGNGEYQERDSVVGRLVPSKSLVSDVTHIDANGCFAITRNGTVLAWGENLLFSRGTQYVYGKLGDFSGNKFFPTPFELTMVRDITSISSGSVHVLVLKKDGTVWGWGSNYNGQLGDGGKTGVLDRNTRFPPIQTSLVKAKIDNVKAISASGEQSMALKNDGTVWTWGTNPDSTYGVSTPTKVEGLTDVIAISAGNYHYMALKSDGSVWVWGDNHYGQAGVNGQLYQNMPLQIMFDDTIKTPDAVFISANFSANQTVVITPAPNISPLPGDTNGTATSSGNITDNEGIIATQPGNGLVLQIAGLLLLVGLIAGGILLYKRK